MLVFRDVNLPSNSAGDLLGMANFGTSNDFKFGHELNPLVFRMIP